MELFKRHVAEIVIIKNWVDLIIKCVSAVRYRIKLDMSKAYDRVEWTFLKGMLLKLGFKKNWVDLIMKCVSTVRYRIKVNDEVCEMITPQRGLREGYPLSP
jgi:hypothetical protein